MRPDEGFNLRSERRIVSARLVDDLRALVERALQRTLQDAIDSTPALRIHGASVPGGVEF
jgi:hypothetical protein